MSLFNEQLKYRKAVDDKCFAESISAIADSVMRKRMVEALSDREVAKSSLDYILRYYHVKPSEEDIPASLTQIEDQLEFVLRPANIMRRSAELDKGWYRHAIGPMLGTFKENGQAVAFLPGRVSGYVYVDVATGKRIRINRANADLFDKEVLCFYKPLPLKSIGIKDLLKYGMEQLAPSDLISYLLMVAATTGLGMLTPFFTKRLFGVVILSRDLRVLAAMAVFMVSHAIANLCIGTFTAFLNNRITVKQDVAIRAAVTNRLLSLPAGFFRDYSSGELSRRADQVSGISHLIMQSAGGIGITALFSFVYIAQASVYAPELVPPALIAALATVAVTVILTMVDSRYTEKYAQVNAKTNGMSYAMISGIQKIKLAGAEKRMFARWAKQYAEESKLLYNRPIILRLTAAITAAINLASTLIMYSIAISRGISIDNFYAFSSAFSMVTASFQALCSVSTIIATIKPILNLARPILEAAPEVTESREVVSSLRGEIEMSHVSFCYKAGLPNVIEDLSLKIEPGEYVAVVGKTGCGKSTLLRLLLGFETPQKGNIYYDKKDISGLELKSLRQRIGTVMQDGKLFMGDIYSNIVISAPQLTLDDAWEAAEKAAIADDIRNMPMEMNTLISDGLGGISGGQRQRLMIARAIAPKPKILFFDEATSALDNVTQKKVSEAIDSLHCTRLVIAHRLSTIRHCDRILVMDGGRITESGTYEELIAKNGFFADLVKRQRLDTDAD